MEVRVGERGELSVGRARPFEGGLSAAEVEVALLACSLSELDVRLSLGELPEPCASSRPWVVGHSGFCGVVVRCGLAVSHCRRGDRVLGIVSAAGDGALRDVLRCDASCVARIDAPVDAAAAACCVEPALRALLALQFQWRGLRGETVLVCDAARPGGDVAVQVAARLGLAAVVHAASTAEATVLEARFPGVRVVVAAEPAALAAGVRSATDGLGVDCVYETRAAVLSPVERRARVDALAPHGTWCVQREQQLDEPEARALLLRAARVAHVWPQAWLVAPTVRGRFVHVLQEIARLLPQLAVSSVDRFPLAKASAARDAVTRSDAAVAVVMGSAATAK